MGNAAVQAAKSIGYIGVGTIEFLWEERGFYFMEMNTRIQARAPCRHACRTADLSPARDCGKHTACTRGLLARMRTTARVAGGEAARSERSLPLRCRQSSFRAAGSRGGGGACGWSTRSRQSS